MAEEGGGRRLRGAGEDLRALEWGQLWVGRRSCREGWGDPGTFVGAEGPCWLEFSGGGRACGGGGAGKPGEGNFLDGGSRGQLCLGLKELPGRFCGGSRPGLAQWVPGAGPSEECLHKLH